MTEIFEFSTHARDVPRSKALISYGWRKRETIVSNHNSVSHLQKITGSAMRVVKHCFGVLKSGIQIHQF